MELDKKCIGNDFSLSLYVYRLNDKAVVTEGEILENGVPEDLTNAKNLVLKLYRLKDGRSTILDPVITGNELKANINADIQRLDVYGVVLNYDKDNAAFKDGLQHFKTDIKVFEIVQTMDEVTSCDITVIGLVRAGTDGMSAFDIWKTEQNNNDLTVTDYLAYLQKPATDAVAAGELTLEQYVLAAQSAQLASEQAKSAAQSFAQGAYNSAGVAVTSEANALDYKNAAALSETKAKISEDNAKLSETRAGTSEANSKASETNAAGSELNAGTSELNAKASEEATLLSEQKAKISEDNSKTSETNSKDSENKAKTSETNAKTSETNSKTSETNAQSSEAKAKTSETNAKASETAAAASAQQAAATLSSKANQTDLVQLSSDLNENIEPSLAEILNAMAGRIIALESIIKNSVYKNMQVDTLDIVKGFSIYGSTNLVLTGTAAPSVVPDFVGQFYVNTTGGVCYQAKGISSTSDWKQTSN